MLAQDKICSDIYQMMTNQQKYVYTACSRDVTILQ